MKEFPRQPSHLVRQVGSIKILSHLQSEHQIAEYSKPKENGLWFSKYSLNLREWYPAAGHLRDGAGSLATHSLLWGWPVSHPR